MTISLLGLKIKVRLITNGIVTSFQANDSTQMIPMLGIPFMTDQPLTTSIVDFSNIKQIV